MALFSGKDNDADLLFFMRYNVLHDLPCEEFDISYKTEFPNYVTMENTDGNCFLVRDKGCQFLMTYSGENAQLFSITNRLSSSQFKSAKELVRVAVQNAKDRGVKQILLEDSIMLCGEDKRILKNNSIAEYWFMCYGKTWYESIYPFKICEIGNYNKYNRKVIQERSWADVVKRFDEVSNHKKWYPTMLEDLPADISDIDINAPGSVMSVFRRINDLKYITDYLHVIMNLTGITHMIRTYWRLTLDDVKS